MILGIKLEGLNIKGEKLVYFQNINVEDGLLPYGFEVKNVYGTFVYLGYSAFNTPEGMHFSAYSVKDRRNVPQG